MNNLADSWNFKKNKKELGYLNPTAAKGKKSEDDVINSSPYMKQNESAVGLISGN